MATRLFSYKVGLGADTGNTAITEAVGSATTTSAIELTVDLANVLSGSTAPVSREDVLLALETFTDYVTKVNWPPA